MEVAMPEESLQYLLGEEGLPRWAALVDEGREEKGERSALYA